MGILLSSKSIVFWNTLNKSSKLTVSKAFPLIHPIKLNSGSDNIEYKCECCGKIVHEEIPNHLKEECQYGSTLKSLVLALTNVGNVPFNKQRRILS